MYSQEDLKMFANTMEIRRALANTEHMLSDRERETIGVTSAQRSEGKTTVALSLALSSALNHTNFRVLLMDLNWHDPAVHESFGIHLGEELGAESSFNLSALVRSTRVHGLDVLVPTRAVLRGSLERDNPHDFALELLNQAKATYNLTVVDTRSLFPANQKFRIDSAGICSELDAVVMVALEAVTPKQEVKRGLKALEGAGASNVGIILNQWKNRLH